MRVTVSAILLALLSWASPAEARQRRSEPDIGLRGFAEVASQSFAAEDTFDAIFGETRGTFAGGGGQFRWRSLVFEVAASRFEDTGERVFVSGGQVFRLGIPTTVTIRPLEFTGLYLFRPFGRVRPYAGGGFGTHSYEETSEFASSNENVEDSGSSRHVVGGAEVRIWRWISAAAEVRYRSVSDVLGDGGVSQEFGEDNLGGTSVAVRILVIAR